MAKKKATKLTSEKAATVVDDVNPIDDTSNPNYIKPPTDEDSGSTAHHIRASRGEDLGFYQVPQSKA